MFQKSWSCKVKEVDANTDYFYARVKMMDKRNSISAIREADM
jgi:hypothetical protein